MGRPEQVNHANKILRKQRQKSIPCSDASQKEQQKVLQVSNSADSWTLTWENDFLLVGYCFTGHVKILGKQDSCIKLTVMLAGKACLHF